MKEPNAKQQDIPVLEWVVAVIGFLLVSANLTLLGWRAIQEKTPPEFAASIDKIEQVKNAELVMIKIENRGGTPVANLRIKAKFGSSEMTREVVIDYLPSHSSRQVGFVTKAPDPASGLQIEFVSFNEP